MSVGHPSSPAAPAKTKPHRDLRTSVALLAALLAWDLAGADLGVIRLFGGPGGFAWRDNRWASAVLHDGGRALAWVVVAVLIGAAFRAPASGAPGRRERLDWLGIMLLCSLAIPAVKRFSATSCPWDLAEFGGSARYVSHWYWGLADGGPGHCFPSGHAVAAFAFLGMYFLWRDHDRRRARLWLLGVLGAGVLFGMAQLARGAHYPSHTLWTAWLCWSICAGAAALRRLPKGWRAAGGPH